MADPRFDWKSVILFLTSAYLQSYFVPANSIRLPNVGCSVNTEVVQVDPDKNRYVPSFVELCRCRGSIANNKPTVKKCVPTAVKTLDLTVWDTTAHKHVPFQIKNHTNCGAACAQSKSDCNKYQTWTKGCICACNHLTSPCEAPFIWNKERCDCECPTRPQKCEHDRKEWSDEICGCTCKNVYSNRCARKKKVLDHETCSCIVPSVIQVQRSSVTTKQNGECTKTVKTSFVILIVILVFFALVSLFTLFYKYCLKKESSNIHGMTGTLKKKLSHETKRKLNKNNSNFKAYKALDSYEGQTSRIAI